MSEKVSKENEAKNSSITVSVSVFFIFEHSRHDINLILTVYCILKHYYIGLLPLLSSSKGQPYGSRSNLLRLLQRLKYMSLFYVS